MVILIPTGTVGRSAKGNVKLKLRRGDRPGIPWRQVRRACIQAVRGLSMLPLEADVKIPVSKSSAPSGKENLILKKSVVTCTLITLASISVCS